MVFLAGCGTSFLPEKLTLPVPVFKPVDFPLLLADALQDDFHRFMLLTAIR